MKNAIIKLRGRGYLIGNLLFLSVLLLILPAFSVCLSILPEVATQLLSDLSEKVQSITVIVLSLLIIVTLFCIFSIFGMGLCRYFLRKAERKGGGLKDIFFYFSPSESFGVLSFFIRYVTMKVLLFAICFLPFFICSIFLGRLIKYSASLGVAFVLIFTDFLFLLLGIVVFSLFNTSLFLVKYYYANGTFLNFRQLVASSQSEMKNKGKSLLKLQLSFAGWFISCLTVIPSVYVILYYSQSKAVLAAEFMNG